MPFVYTSAITILGVCVLDAVRQFERNRRVAAFLSVLVYLSSGACYFVTASMAPARTGILAS